MINKIRPFPSIIILSVCLTLLRITFPERGMDALGFRALTDAVFSLGLWILVWTTAIGTGRWFLRKYFNVNDFTAMEQFVFESGFGLGVIGTGITILGVTGHLRIPFILSWLLICAAAWGTDDIQFKWPHFPKESAAKGVLLSAGIIIALTVVQVLTPPWDYDGLMYHLEGPRRFLESGRIFFIPEIWQANGPFLTEMIFSIGLAFQSDTFPKLIHMTFALLIGLATFGFADRFLSRGHAWTSLAILLGIAILPIWASWAYTDIAWALYEFLAVYSITIWLSRNENILFLVLAGLFSGMAMGTKYLAIAGTGLITLWVIWESRRYPVKKIFTNLFGFLAAAILISSPWWIKNASLTGNPLYPFIFASSTWDSKRISWLMSYLQSFGTGRAAWDYLLLPINLYFRHNNFSTYSTESPSLLFPISLIYVFQRDHRMLNKIGLYAIATFLVWAAGSQQVRFLLPIFPILSILSASVLLSFRSLRFRRVATISLVGGLCVASLIYQGLYLYQDQPLSVVLGMESKTDFLRRNVRDFKAVEYINSELPPSSKVLLLWDGQSYYCRKCIPDTDQITWLVLAGNFPKTRDLVIRFNQSGITHILFSTGNYLWFQKYHGSGGALEASMALLKEFISNCGNEVYRDEISIIYEITCR